MLFLLLGLGGCGDDDSGEKVSPNAAAGREASSGVSGGSTSTSTSTSGPGGAGGSGASASAGSGGAPEVTPGSFSDIYQNVFTTCKLDTCHGGGLAGLNMSSKQAAFDSLVDQPSSPKFPCKDLGKKRVVPENPDESLLYLKLDVDAPCGQQMPPGGQLPEAARAKIHDWIAAGANND